MSQLKKSFKNVRSPRRVAASIEHFPQSIVDVMAVKERPAKLMKVTPTKDQPLADWLWENSLTEANRALYTDFIQGIKSGLLDPTDYGGYTVQDAVYCFNAINYFQTAQGKCSDLTLKAFLRSRVRSFAKYTQYLFEQWHIREPDGIAMGYAATSYTTFEKDVADDKDPIYLVIAMLPCEQLWEWLAEQIKSGISETNVYSFWIEENLDGSHKLANFVNEYAESFGVNPETANQIYQQGMQGEVMFFQSATQEVASKS